MLKATHVTAALVLVGYFASWPPARALAQGEQRAPRSSDERRHAEQLRVANGLRAAAALHGRYEGGEPGGSTTVPADLKALAWLGDVVVVGRVLGAASALSSDGRHINTEHRIQVTRAFATRTSPTAAVREGDEVRVNLRGGRITFEDGSEAVTSAPSQPALSPGRTYAFFLAQIAADRVAAVRGAKGTYYLTAHDAAYEIGPTEGVRSSGGSRPLEAELAKAGGTDQVWLALARAADAARSYPPPTDR
jgi:hypothetical protein